MADPITYRRTRERFKMPRRKPASARTGVVGPHGPEQELSVRDRLALAKAEGRTPQLSPEELVAFRDEQREPEVTPQSLGLLPSRGPVDEPSDPLRAIPGVEAPGESPSPPQEISRLVKTPEAPEMVNPPTLHSPEEIEAGIGDPDGPPTISRTPDPRGEPVGDPVGDDGGLNWSNVLRKALGAMDEIARGAEAGSRTRGGLLAGWGAASNAAQQREMGEQAFSADQRARQAQTDLTEQRAAAIPEQLEIDRQSQDLANSYQQAREKYMQIMTADIAQRMGERPDRLRLDELKIAADWAHKNALIEVREEELRKGRALSPQEAELRIQQALTQQEMQGYYRSGTELRGAQRQHELAQAEHVGEPRQSQGVRIQSPTVIRKAIADLRDTLRQRYQDRMKRVDEQAMQADPDFERLEDLEKLYERSLAIYMGKEPEADPGGVSPGFDPYRIRNRARQMMGGSGAR